MQNENLKSAPINAENLVSMVLLNALLYLPKKDFVEQLSHERSR